MTTDEPAAAGGPPDPDPGHDACAVCGVPVAPRSGGSQLVGGRLLVREIGSCLACGLQLVRFCGEGWREIRG